ncbi:MAG: thioredoxin domain-containing protein [Alphaproteobacteria bacterium]|nr:thioredoxin domain-containing protein [Alphaproteobacteria bacterium]
MMRFIALAAIALAALYLVYDIYRISTAFTGLSDVPPSYALGPDDADVTVVEFMDYGCMFCREVHPTITQATIKDGRVRYIPRPVAAANSKDSAYAAVIAYAAGQQGKFIEMHDLLIREPREITAAVLSDLATRAGVDEAKLLADMQSPELMDLVRENGNFFNRINATATPTFVIGKNTIYVPEGRMPEVQDFLNMFARIRQKNK